MPYDLEKFRQENPAYGNSSLREIATDLFNFHRPSFEAHGIKSVEDWGNQYGLQDTWASDEQGIADRRRQSEIESTRQKNLDEKNWGSRAVARGIDQFESMLYGGAGLAGAATGVEPLKKWGLEGYQRNIEEASLYPGTEFKEIGEAKGLGKVGKGAQWGVEKLLENLPILATMPLTGGLGGFAAGKVAPKAFSMMLKSQVRRELSRNALKTAGKKLTNEAIEKGVTKNLIRNASKESLDLAQKEVMRTFLGPRAGLVLGMGAVEGGGMFGEASERGFDDREAALKSLGFGMMAGAVELMGGLGPAVLNRMFGKQKAGIIARTIESVSKAAKRGKKEPGKMRFLANAFKSAADNAPQEFAQEAAQEVLSLMNIASNDPTFEVFSEENMGRILESGWAGAAVGGLLGGTMGAFKAPKKTDKITGEPVEDTTGRPEYTDIGQDVIASMEGSQADPDYWFKAREAQGPAYVASMILNGVANTGLLKNRSIRKALQDPNTDPKERAEAIRKVAAAIENPELAREWLSNAYAAKTQNLSIPLDLSLIPTEVDDGGPAKNPLDKIIDDTIAGKKRPQQLPLEAAEEFEITPTEKPPEAEKAKEPFKMTREEYDSWRISQIDPSVTFEETSDEISSLGKEGGVEAQWQAKENKIVRKKGVGPGRTTHEIRHLLDRAYGLAKKIADIVNAKKSFPKYRQWLLSRGYFGVGQPGEYFNTTEAVESLINEYFKNPNEVEKAFPELKKLLDDRGLSNFKRYNISHRETVEQALKEGKLTKEEYNKLHAEQYGPIEEFAPNLAKPAEAKAPKEVGKVETKPKEYEKTIEESIFSRPMDLLDEKEYLGTYPKKDERATLKTEGFTNEYIAPDETVKVPDSRSFGRHVFTKEPLSLEDISRLNLKPMQTEERGRIAREYYTQKYSNKPVELYRERDTTLKGSIWHGAIVFPSSKKKGYWQLSYFDKDGFSGDTQYKTENEAIGEAIEEGYKSFKPGLLDKVSAKPEFIEGIEKGEKAQKEWAEAQKRIDKRAEKPAKPEAPKAETLPDISKYDLKSITVDVTERSAKDPLKAIVYRKRADRAVKGINDRINKYEKIMNCLAA